MRRATYHVEREVSRDHWWFRGRRRILSRLLAGLDLPPGARILDAGCGTGANTSALAAHGRVFGVDASPVPLRGDGRAVLARLEALPARSLRSLLTRAGLRVQRLSYFNTVLFLPILAARLAMRVIRLPVATENNLTTPALNRLLGAVFSAEAPLLARADLPFGVSLLALARR
jgi:SAM-dependent methyltransferase